MGLWISLNIYFYWAFSGDSITVPLGRCLCTLEAGKKTQPGFGLSTLNSWKISRSRIYAYCLLLLCLVCMILFEASEFWEKASSSHTILHVSLVLLLFDAFFKMSLTVTRATSQTALIYFAESTKSEAAIIFSWLSFYLVELILDLSFAICYMNPSVTLASVYASKDGNIFSFLFNVSMWP